MVVKIITDSCADIPEGIAKKLDISIVPLHINFSNQSFIDGINITKKAFYEKMRQVKELPKTASPSPFDFTKKLKKIIKEDISVIIITISDKLSSSFQNATIAKNTLAAGTKIDIINSFSGSIGQGINVIRAAFWAKEGMEHNQIVDKLRDIIKSTETLTFLENLENAIKGGRINHWKGKLASILNLKTLMYCSEEGKVELLSKVRGSSKALNQLVELIGKRGKNLEGKIMGIAHSNDRERAEMIKQWIKEKYSFKEIIITEIGPAMGVYTGEKGIVLGF